MVTEVICTYRIGDTCVQFPHNGDAGNVRFEQAFSWAVKYAAAHGIENVYGVFELSRPLDRHYMNRICPRGLIDRRARDPYEDAAEESAGLCAKCSKPLSGTKAATPPPSKSGREPVSARLTA
jgi:hypothetical protein